MVCVKISTSLWFEDLCHYGHNNKHAVKGLVKRDNTD